MWIVSNRLIMKSNLFCGFELLLQQSVSFMFGYEQAEAKNLEGDKSEVDLPSARIQVLW